MHPGNMDYRARDMTVSSINFADMAALHAADTGTEKARLPWATPITAFQTLQGSLHRFSFHEPGEPNGGTDQRTHAQFRQVWWRQVDHGRLPCRPGTEGRGPDDHLDKEAGLKMPCMPLERPLCRSPRGTPDGLNPLANRGRRAREAWLLDWLLALLESPAPGR